MDFKILGSMIIYDSVLNYKIYTVPVYVDETNFILAVLNSSKEKALLDVYSKNNCKSDIFKEFKKSYVLGPYGGSVFESGFKIKTLQQLFVKSSVNDLEIIIAGNEKQHL